jgi:adenosylhomocysteine/aminodeoxyfutalosine nucleosidase
MKIGIIGAMVEEIQPILDHLKDYKIVEEAENKFYLATYKNHELIIVYSKIGKVFSSLTATTLVLKFGVEKILFSGVAGGINPNLKIGDLIFASKLAQHDLDITAFGHPHGFVPEGSVFIETSKELNEIAKEVAKDLEIDLLEGVIATGDQFVANNERKEWIQRTFNADALEMEGASVAVVAKTFDIPFFVLRSISDTADTDAGFDFDKFLESSAKVSANFILKMVEKI